MEYQKIVNFLSKFFDRVPRFITKKWIEIYDKSGGTYNQNKDIRFKVPQLRSGLCVYNDAYIAVTGKITVTNPNNDTYDKKLALKNNAPFYSCVLRINSTLVEDAQELDIIMPMYNLLYYSKNYRKTAGSLWNYYRDEPNSGAQRNINYSIKDSQSFDYKASITGQLENNEDEKDVKIVAPLKHLSKFFRELDIPLINCGISLDLKWSKNCVLTSKATRKADPAINNPTNAEFSITDCKLYVPVVTVSIENQNILYEQLKEGFTITIYWNKYRCQISNQRINNNLNYLIDPTFDQVNRLFILAFENEEGRLSFSKYYRPPIEIKDCNVLIDQKPFFEIPLKNKEETYQANNELVRNSDYTTGKFLDYDYFSTHYKLIAIDLSKQDVDLNKQQISFIGRLEQNATIYSIIEKEEQTALKISQNSVNVS